MEILEGKKEHIDDLCDQAAALKEDDTQKKNGTSDVESRYSNTHRKHYTHVHRYICTHFPS